MNIYEKIYCEESKNRAKAYSELCDITERQIRDFEKLQQFDSSQFPPIVAGLLRDEKLLQAEHLVKQINFHLKRSR